MAMDKCFAAEHSSLAAYGKVVPDLDARLVMIEDGSDKFHIVQVIKEDHKYYVFQRWGQTGGRGSSELSGPLLMSAARGKFNRVFEEKVGAPPSEVKVGDRARPGRYWLQQQAQADTKAKWEYYVSDGVDGKSNGWYPYESAASDEVEEIYAQHEANDRDSRTAKRMVSSGFFSYTVDLESMRQTNTRTNKMREIRRVFGFANGSQDAIPFRGSMKVMKALRVVRPAPSIATIHKARSTKIVMKQGLKKKAMQKVLKKTIKKAIKKAMKKVMKKSMKEISTVARGKRCKAAVWNAWKGKVKTSSGKTKKDMKRNSEGKIVYRKQSTQGAKAFSNVANWIAATKQARKVLGLKGFVAMKKGTDFYDKTRELYESDIVQPHELFRKVSFVQSVGGA